MYPETKQRILAATICVCCCGSLAMLIISFIWMCLARSQHTLMVDSYSSLVSNWDNDMVFDITGNANYPLLSSNYYLQPWSGYWPGTIKGCWCPITNSRRKVYRGLKDRGCNSNETRTSCENIAPTDKRDLTKWTAGQTIYTVRGKDTSFLDTYQKMNQDGSCVSGYKRCGNPSSVAKGLCIPEGFSSCPLTDIASTAKIGYNSVPLTGFTLYTNIDKLANPVSDLLVRESHLCFIRGQMPKTAGRDRYKLLIGDYESCQNDPTSWSLAEIGEKDYFDINDVPYGKLTTFDTNNDYKYKLFAGRYLEWSPSCSDAVPSLTKKGEDLTYIKKQMLILLILYSIVIGLMGIYNIAQVLLFIDDKKKIYKRVYFARLVAFVLVVPSLIIVTVHTGRFVKYFKNIVDIKCSTDDSNVQFEKIYTHYDQKVYKRVVVMIVLAFCNLIVDSLVAMIFLGVHETIGEWLDRARSPHNSPDSLAKRNNDQLPPPIDTKYNQVSPVPLLQLTRM